MKHIVATELTAKELVEQIANRLHGNYKSASDEAGKCMYRSGSSDPDVSPACGVGLCLPDKVATALDAKGNAAGYILNKEVIRPYVQPKDLTADETDLLMSAIQQTHDCTPFGGRIDREEFKRTVLEYVVYRSFGSATESLFKKLTREGV